MDFVNLPLFAAAALVFCSVLAGLYSARIGFSFLLVFLLAGVLAGEDGPGRFRFDDYRLSFWVGNLALAVILLDGGLRTSFRTFRIGFAPAGVLATVGVFICAGITAVAGVFLADLGWGEALLLGAIVGSTDAAAVFSLLQRSGVRLSPRVEATLEIESGVNDPMAVFLTVAMLGLLGGSIDGATPLAANGRKDWIDLLQVFGLQFGLGSVIGVGSGFAMALLLERVAAHRAGSAQALLLGAAGLAVFSLTGLLGGSGFLAVYLFGLIVANRAADAVGPTLAAMDGYAWLAQAGMFLLLGLLVTPSDLVGRLGPALGVAAVLMLVARPVAIWLCLLPFRFKANEVWFIAWVGLRGAVPVVLAMYPLLSGIPNAETLFDIAFVVVLVSLMVQGTTIGAAARRTGVAQTASADGAASQRSDAGRDYELDPQMTLASICAFYQLPPPDTATLTLADWLNRSLNRPPVVGDSVNLGKATVVVRELHDGRIARAGLSIPS